MFLVARKILEFISLGGALLRMKSERAILEDRIAVYYEEHRDSRKDIVLYLFIPRQYKNSLFCLLFIAKLSVLTRECERIQY